MFYLLTMSSGFVPLTGLATVVVVPYHGKRRLPMDNGDFRHPKEVYAPSVQTADELKILCKLEWAIQSSSNKT